MKVRTGFVSNSSTSSFVCIFVGVKLSDFAERRLVQGQRTKYNEDTGKPYEIEEDVYRTWAAGRDITDEIPEHRQQEALEYQIYDWLGDCGLTTYSHDAQGYPGCYVGMTICETRELNEVVGFPDPSEVEEKRRAARNAFEQVGFRDPLQILLLTQTSS